MKVAVVYTHFPHYREPIFGAMKNDDRCSFSFYCDVHGIENTIKSSQLTDVCTHLETKKFGPFMWQVGVLRLALLGDFDKFIFLGNPYILSTWLAAVVLNFRHKEIVFWTHGWLKKETGLKKIVRNTFYRLANKLFLYGERARDIGIYEYGFNSNNIQVIGNSLNYSKQKHYCSILEKKMLKLNKFPLEGGKPYFLIVSRLTRETGINMAIEALAMLSEDCRLVIIGDGPEHDDLVKLASNLDVDVTFIPALYDERFLSEYFFNAIATVSPGKVGLLAIHSLVYGTPVITHNNFDYQMPEFEAIECGVTGDFFEHGSSLALSYMMLEFLKKNCSIHNKSETLKVADKVIRKKFSPASQLESIIKGLKLDA